MQSPLRAALACAALLAAGAAVNLAGFGAPSQAEAAPCAQWTVPDHWRIQQSGDLTISVSGSNQRGSRFQGKAAFYDPDRGWRDDVVGGDLQGSIDGDQFRMDVYWDGDDKADGVYEGRIDPDGRVAGSTYDRAHPGNHGTWYISQPMVCAAEMSDLGDRPVELPSRHPSRPYAESAQTPDMARPSRNPALPTPDLARPRPAPSYADAVEGPSMGAAQGALATCLSGYVWRVAVPEDLVCVTPASRSLVAQENRAAAQRRDPGGAYGPDTCVPGYVWREAFEGDLVCVTPERRQAVKEENSLAASRRVGG